MKTLQLQVALLLLPHLGVLVLGPLQLALVLALRLVLVLALVLQLALVLVSVVEEQLFWDLNCTKRKEKKR